MSTTTPDGPERSGGAAPPEAEERPAPAGGDRTAVPDERGQDGSPAKGSSSALRRSLAERFAASSAGVRAAAARTAPRQGGGAQAPRRPATAAGGSGSAGAASDGPRRVRLSLSRVDPWSMMKLAFLGSVAIGIGLVVATA
ncbi:DUF3566 domain-containing protein, partial [Georgenia sp. 10Sc9-8]|nr:DUF3566 domain-containing protein [Georgenia halotolerans]